jgi:hypothetical protein
MVRGYLRDLLTRLETGLASGLALIVRPAAAVEIASNIGQ